MALFTCSTQSFCHVLAIFTLLFLGTAKVRLESIKVAPHLKSNTEFIRTSCGVTLYPDICFKTLSTYSATIKTSPSELTSAALNVSLRSAESTSNLVSKLSKGHNLTQREAGALNDCLESMENSVDELKESLFAMRNLEGTDFDLEKSNIQTWVSAALTEEDTCLDGFEENAIDGDIKALIRSNIVRVGKLTSNALALVNRLSPSLFHSP